MTKRRILVVEDDKPTRDSVVGILRRRQYHVDAAENGQHALDILQEYDYDLIITDLMMPVTDGVHFIHRMRSNGYDTPVIVVTAYENVDSTLALLQMGALDILDKPYDTRELLALIESALN